MFILKFSLEQKLSQRRARLAEVQSQQELAKQQRRELTDKEVKQMKDKLVSWRAYKFLLVFKCIQRELRKVPRTAEQFGMQMHYYRLPM